MKVFKDESVYVQKNDLINILQLGDLIPHTILKKAFNGKELVIDDNNRYDFVEFNLPDEVFFFKRQDWIIDYDNYSYYDDEMLEKIAHTLYKQNEELVDNFNKLSNEDQEIQHQEMIKKHRQLRHMFNDLRHLSEYKKGIMNMIIPGEEPGEVINMTQEEAKKAVIR